MKLQESNSDGAAPFVKWAGGKSQLLPEISAHLPRVMTTYHEPFLGSGAVYFHLWNLRNQGRIRFKNAKLSDINEELITTFGVVRDSVQALMEALSLHQARHSEDYYYRVRSVDAPTLAAVERAARFIYLNKTCFNGLYRVNSKGAFNVPLGRYTKPNILDKRRLATASLALAGVELRVADFRKVAMRTHRGDFVYFDPPYVPLTSTASFTSYTRQGFHMEEQKSLAEVVRALKGKGVDFLLSNSSTGVTKRLYKAFPCREVLASRAINSKSGRRGKIKELLVAAHAHAHA